VLSRRDWHEPLTDRAWDDAWVRDAVARVASARSVPPATLEGASLTWAAGPFDRTEKGAGLCHGTAGNGYALLRTFELTQDELWLERARSFAVHALEQALALAPRYSLFTGAIGVALFAVDCVDGTARFPVLEWM
jgi:hypothetical protein